MKVIVGITGASGTIYAEKLIKILKAHQCEVHLVTTRHGEEVGKFELGDTRWQMLVNHANFVYDCNQMWSRIASGSFKIDTMVIIPCSMRTIASIANGISDNLLLRAADVMLKEHRKLIIVARETPLSSIHLHNMWSLANNGVHILPASPGFYHHPKTLEELVDMFVMRICDAIGIQTDLAKRWGE